MKKIIFGLLIIAAGTAAFYLIRNQKGITVKNEITKEWILGKWKLGEGNDSNVNEFQFDFQKDGIVVKSLNNSSKADTSYYEWNKANELVWRERANDSTGKVYVVAKLTMDSLQIQGADSTTVFYIRKN